jgi:hypothetical protein
MIPKGISRTSFPNPQIYILEKEITNSRDSNLEYPVLLKFPNSIWKYVVPFADSRMALPSSALLYRIYFIIQQAIIILFWKYLVDITSEAWLTLVW